MEYFPIFMLVALAWPLPLIIHHELTASQRQGEENDG